MANNDTVVGTIISTDDGPNTINYDFIIKEIIQKNMFVKCNDVLAVVEEIISSNPYYAKAEAVAYYEKERTMSDIYPTARSNYTVARARILGKIDHDKILRVTYPVKPGDTVEIADNESIKMILGLDKQGLWIGNLENHNLKIKLNITKLFKKHLAILAMSGAGKSYSVSVLLEEMMKTNPMVPIVLIDVHGEYAPLFKNLPANINTKVKIIETIQIGFKNVNSSMLAQWINTSEAQEIEISKQINKVRHEFKGSYDINDVVKKILDTDGGKQATKEAAIRKLEYLDRLDLFDKMDSITLEQLIKPNQLSIINMRNIDSQKVKQMIVSYYAKRMFTERKRNKIPPFILLLEEAHNFANQSAQDKNLSKSILQTIAREGRKFGASLVMVSQRPVQLDTTVLSQCNTHAILRVTNPNDIKHIQESSEGFNSTMARELPGLTVGEMYLVGEAVNKPVLFKVRKRELQSSVRDKTLEEMVKEWNEKDEEIESYL